jgi:hypothetical protein
VIATIADGHISLQLSSSAARPPSDRRVSACVKALRRVGLPASGRARSAPFRVAVQLIDTVRGGLAGSACL